ncbi:MAG TPA: MarP family serine protease [Acidimicrobiales bacterium]|nr:MarP family serine protease [Acidimicrobiales bacterium]
MNAFDLVVLGIVIVAGTAGFRLGFVTRAASWVGLAVGFYIAVRVLPSLLRSVGPDGAATRLGLAALVIFGGTFLGQAVGMVTGNRLVSSVPKKAGLRTLDHTLGLCLGAFGVLAIVWLLLPTLAAVPGLSARLASGSLVARTIDRVAPPPPDAADTVRRLVGGNGFPQVFDALRPAPDLGPPPESLSLSPEMQARVARSTVKVESNACDRLQQGSGFAAGEDLIVTNAHVVAGESRTVVIRTDGRRRAATVIVFDPDRDLAVLSVPELGQEPLPIGEGKAGMEGAVFGHPEGQEELRIAAAAIRQRVEAVGRDLYDEKPTDRDVFILAARLLQGDSGGALVGPEGTVLGVAFAVAPDNPDTAYALTSAELREVLAEPTRGEVDTGPCLRAA